MKTKAILFGTIGVIIVGTIAVAVLSHRQSGQSSVGSLVDRATLKSLPTRDASSADTSHLDSSVQPPTNSWLSGMVLQKTPLPVYPMPLSFLAKETGFEVGLPNITSTPTVISGGHLPGLGVAIDQAQSFTLMRYDKISATLRYSDARKNALGTLTLAEGSPYVFYEPVVSGKLVLHGVTAEGLETQDDHHYLRYTKDKHDYVALVTGNGSIVADNQTATVTLEKDSFATFYALPDTKSDTLKQFASNKLTGVETKYEVDSNDVRTILTYETANQRPTAFAAPAYRTIKDPGQTLNAYDNIYGTMPTVSGTAFTLAAPLTGVSNRLDISHLTDAHKQSLVASLKHDAAAVKITASDSYYAGKQLARAANLLDLADQLQQPDVAKQLTTTLRSELTKRLDGSYFYYDSKLHGVAANTKAFGSEDFNDHHFHYGYFIYAAGVLGRLDSQFVADYKQKVNLLVADIANYELTAEFPLQRNYDPYAGHSWAAGLAPFADGNNQESSSEAMNAWNAVALWGKLINNDQLTRSGQWMLAHESQSAKQAWRSSPERTPTSANFTSPLTSLNFGGKRTYSTFFSDDANAKLAIQLIPMSPSMVSLRGDNQNIDRQIKAAIVNDNYNVPLGDYILMYLGLDDPQKAIKIAEAQKDTFIDDGNSRTYINAWLFAQLDK